MDTQTSDAVTIPIATICLLLAFSVLVFGIRSCSRDNNTRLMSKDCIDKLSQTVVVPSALADFCKNHMSERWNVDKKP